MMFGKLIGLGYLVEHSQTRSINNSSWITTEIKIRNVMSKLPLNTDEIRFGEIALVNTEQLIEKSILARLYEEYKDKRPNLAAAVMAEILGEK